MTKPIPKAQLVMGMNPLPVVDDVFQGVTGLDNLNIPIEEEGANRESNMERGKEHYAKVKLIFIKIVND